MNNNIYNDNNNNNNKLTIGKDKLIDNHIHTVKHAHTYTLSTYTYTNTLSNTEAY